MNKYQIVRVIDEGAYGVVLEGRHKDSGLRVAIKKFKETEEDELIRRNIQREVRMLRLLKSEYVVKLRQALKHKGRIFLVFEYFDKNLLNVLEEYSNGLESETIRSVIYQLVKSLSYLHYNKIIHRDIKPENILLSSHLRLKLCDFGFARPLPDPDDKLTDYVATRWYRSPELLVGERYGPPLDIWAVGCILGELIDGQPLFPGDDHIDQLYRIQKVLGPLPQEQKELLLKNPKMLGRSMPELGQIETLQRRYLGKLTKNALNFLKACLKLNPKMRITADEALSHPFLCDVSSRDSGRPAAPFQKKPETKQAQQFTRKEQVVSEPKMQQTALYTIYNNKHGGERMELKLKPKRQFLREGPIPKRTVYPGPNPSRSEEKKQEAFPNIRSLKAGSPVGESNINLIYNTNNYNYVIRKHKRK